MRGAENSPLWSVLILAGAQMRTLLAALEADPTTPRTYRDEARELARLWDRTSAELQEPRGETTAVIWLAEEPLCETEPARGETKGSGPVRPRGGDARAMDPQERERRLELLRRELVEGPKTTRELARATGIAYHSTLYLLHQEGFLRRADKRWHAA